jgi:arsenical pump membrane protein
MSGAAAETIAVVLLAASLVFAVVRPRGLNELIIAGPAAVLVVVLGIVPADDALDTLREIGPTIGFLAAILVFGHLCEEAGVFAYLGAIAARASAGDARRLLVRVVVLAAVVTAILTLDATVVLLTPVVLIVATQSRLPVRPHAYACTRLANSASLLLPVSNLTNLLAFAACGVSFTRFAGLMALPWLVALAVEWVVLGRVFADDLRQVADGSPVPTSRPQLPVFALAVVAATLIGFGISSIVQVSPVWFATAGAVVITIHRPPPSLRELVGAAEPAFLVFVLGLGVVVAAAGEHGLSSVVDSLLPSGSSLPALLAVAVVSAVLANLVNNLPATLIIVAVVSGSAPGAVLAMLIGVDVGPNLTYVGSLATLLWRRIVHAHDEEVEVTQFLRLGALTVPVTLIASTTALWLALQVL